MEDGVFFFFLVFSSLLLDWDIKGIGYWEEERNFTNLKEPHLKLSFEKGSLSSLFLMV